MARRLTYTQALWDMEPGSKQTFDPGEVKPETIRTIAWRLGKEEGRRYECRSTPEGYQVWRTA